MIRLKSRNLMLTLYYIHNIVCIFTTYCMAASDIHN